jgi:hypothetical protein
MAKQINKTFFKKESKLKSKNKWRELFSTQITDSSSSQEIYKKKNTDVQNKNGHGQSSQKKRYKRSCHMKTVNFLLMTEILIKTTLRYQIYLTDWAKPTSLRASSFHKTVRNTLP